MDDQSSTTSCDKTFTISSDSRTSDSWLVSTHNLTLLSPLTRPLKRVPLLQALRLASLEIDIVRIDTRGLQLCTQLRLRGQGASVAQPIIAPVGASRLSARGPEEVAESPARALDRDEPWREGGNAAAEHVPACSSGTASGAALVQRLGVGSLGGESEDGEEGCG